MTSPLVSALQRGAWLAVLVAMVGCAPPWIIIKQSGPPSALAHVTSVAVAFNYTNMVVGGGAGDKPEAQWVAEKNVEEPGYEATWIDLKSKWEEAYLTGLSKTSPVPVTRSTGAPGAPGSADLTVMLTRLQIGKYIVISAKASIIDAVHSWSVGGTPVDEIRTSASLMPDMYHPSIFQHVAKLGQQTGGFAGKYMTKAR